jgi:hypothetical protein
MIRMGNSRKTRVVVARIAVCAVVSFALLAASALAVNPPEIVGAVQDPALAFGAGAGPLSGATSVALSGNYAYVTAYSAGKVTAVDIANPATPTIAGESAFSTGLIGGSNIAISGGYAYVVSKNRNLDQSHNDDGSGNALTILDVHTNPAQPTIVGQISDATTSTDDFFGGYGIAVDTIAGHVYAFVAAQGVLQGQPSMPVSTTGQFTVVDVTNPASPALVTSIANQTTGPNGNWLDHPTAVALQAIAGSTYAFVTAFYNNSITVINISNPSSPALVADLSDATNLLAPADLAIEGTNLYVANQNGSVSFAAVNVSTPAEPTIEGTVDSPAALAGAYRIRVLGNTVYVAAANAQALAEIDVTNPAKPSLISYQTSPSHLNSTSGLDVDPTGAFVVQTSPLLGSQASTTSFYPPFPLSATGQPTAAYPETGTLSVLLTNPQPPTNTALPHISGGAPYAGSTLRASTGSWSGMTPVAYTYKWGDCSRSGSNCNSITGATSSTYKVGSHDVGARIEVKVTATNLAGTASVFSTATALVSICPPGDGRYGNFCAVKATLRLSVAKRQNIVTQKAIIARLKCSATARIGVYVLVKVGTAKSFKVNGPTRLGHAGRTLTFKVHLSGKQFASVTAALRAHTPVAARVYGTRVVDRKSGAVTVTPWKQLTVT